MTSPVAPHITDEQRRKALDKARRTVQERKKIRYAMKTGRLKIGEVIDLPVIQGMRVRHLITSVPGIGRVKSVMIMERCRIDDRKRVGGMTPRQKAELLAWFEKSQ